MALQEAPRRPDAANEKLMDSANVSEIARMRLASSDSVPGRNTISELWRLDESPNDYGIWLNNSHS
jgi:hypothetical protein